MAGLLDLLGGGGNTGGIDLNQLVRPPDPLGAALAEMSQRFATAGQASRLPISTLGAIGSALGGAGAAATTAQTQYLDQAIKLQALKQSYMKMGYGESFAQILAQAKAAELARQASGGAAPGTPAVPLMNPGMTTVPGSATPAPGAPAAVPGAGGPFAAGGPFDVPNYSSIFRPTASVPPIGNIGIGGGDQGAGARMQLTSLLGSPGGGLLADPGGTIDPRTGGDLVLSNTGGPAAGVTQANFRPASLVTPAGDGVGSGAGTDPLSLISKYESGGRNIRQQVVPESVSSASGPWMMLDSTFHEAAKKAGIDVSDYKSAEDAPVPLQRAVATALYKDKGYAPWANYNPKLAAAIGGGTPTGGTASPVSALRGLLAGSDSGGAADPLAGLLALATGGSNGADEDPLAGLLKPQDEVIPSGGGLPAGLLQKAAMTAPGPTEPAETTPIDPTSPENLAFTRGANAREGTIDQRVALRGVPGMPQSLDEIAGPGPRPGMRLAQYAPGGGAASVPDAQAVINSLMQQQAPSTAGGVIPGLGMTPQMAAIANAYAEMAGLGSPLKGLLDTYYKNPQYLQDAARAGELGKAQVGLQYGPLTAGLTAGAQAAAQQPYELQKIFAKSQADLINDWDKPQQVPYTDEKGVPRVMTASPRMLAGGRPPEAVFGSAATANAGSGGAGSGEVTSGKGGGLLAPSAAGTVPPGGLRTGLAPGAAEEQKGQGQQLSAFVTKVHGDAETARTQAPDLEMLARVGPNIDWAGPGAPYKQIFNRATASAFGVNTENVASYEMAQQLMGGMLRKALRASDSNPTEKQQQMMLATFPTPESSKQGFAQGVGYMQGIGDWQVFREEALRNWTQTHNNSADGFQENFKISAIPFVVQQMPQATRDAYFAQLKATDPSGKTLHRLADQMDAIKQGKYNYSY